MASRVTRLSTGDPTVLLLTPFMYDARIWADFARTLATRAGVAVAEWPGRGPHRERPEISFSPLAESDLIVEALGDPDVLVATSGDANVAVHLAEHGRTRALVLIEPFDLLDEVEFDFCERLERNIAAVPAEVTRAFENRDAEAMARLNAEQYQDALSPTSLALLRQVFEDNAASWFMDVTATDLWAPESTWSDHLPRLEVPVLVLSRELGPRDEDDVRQRTAQAIASRCGDGRVATFEAETEFPWLEHPDELAGIVLEFIRTSLGSA